MFMTDTEKDVRIYELGYWFVPTIAAEAIVDQVTDLKNKLSLKGAVFITEEEPYLRELAYEMCKVINNKNHYFNEGYFGWIKFELDPSLAPVLHAELELDPNIIRSLITQTVRENTVYTKRPAVAKREDEDNEESVSKEEDKNPEGNTEVDQATEAKPEVESAVVADTEVISVDQEAK